MLKSKIIWLVILAALPLSPRSARAQEAPVSGLYQIISGRFTECCGIAGLFIHTLPEDSEGFVKLIVDSQRGVAHLTFLNQVEQTVFRIPPISSRSEITFSFGNGMVFSDHIQFEQSFPPPLPDGPSWSYTVSNSTGALRISGVLSAPCLGCADIPTEFEHTN